MLLPPAVRTRLLLLYTQAAHSAGYYEETMGCASWRVLEHKTHTAAFLLTDAFCCAVQVLARRCGHSLNRAEAVGHEARCTAPEHRV